MAERPCQVAAQRCDREYVSDDEVAQRPGSEPRSPRALTTTAGADMRWRASSNVSIRYLIAIIVAARTSVHAIVKRNVPSMDAGSASLTTIEPGCTVRH